MITSAARHTVILQDLAHIVAEPLPWDRFEGKTILISGANGFLASSMVETLLYLNETVGLGCEIVALVRNADRARCRFGRHLGRTHLRIIVQNVCDAIEIEGRVDFVIHAASQASPKYYGPDPVGTLTANVVGSRNLLDLARRKESEAYLYFSSSEVYGRIQHGEMGIRESDFGSTDPAQVRSCYAESKRMGETMAVCWAHQFGVRAMIVRPFHTYGPGMSLDDGRVYADFVASVVAGHHLTLHSAGSAMRAFCYLADATAGFFTVLLRGSAAEAYNVGNPQAEISILDLANLLVSLFPEKHLSVEIDPTVRGEAYLPSTLDRLRPSVEKVAALGWRPCTPLAEGFVRTVASFS